MLINLARLWHTYTESVTRNLVPRQIRSSRTEIGSQNRSALLISVRPGALELNKNLNYRGLVDSNPVVDIDTDKDVLLFFCFLLGLIVKNLR